MRQPDPTPKDIRERSREVRTTWTPRQRWVHAGKPQLGWTPPTVRLSDLAAAADEVRQEGGQP